MGSQLVHRGFMLEGAVNEPAFRTVQIKSTSLGASSNPDFLRMSSAIAKVKLAPLPPATSNILSNCIKSGTCPYPPSTEHLNAFPGCSWAALYRSSVNPSCCRTRNSTGVVETRVNGWFSAHRIAGIHRKAWDPGRAQILRRNFTRTAPSGIGVSMA